MLIFYLFINVEINTPYICYTFNLQIFTPDNSFLKRFYVIFMKFHFSAEKTSAELLIMSVM